MSGPAPAAIPASAPAPAPAAPAAAPPSASATINTPAPAAAPAAAPSNVTNISDWVAGLDEGKRGFATNKGWKTAGDAVESYQNLEKLLGAPQDQVLRIPVGDDKAAWDGVFNKLGRPATAADYKIEADAAKGGSPEFAKWAGESFHELGLSTKQGQALAAKFNELQTNMKATQDAQQIDKLKSGQQNLQKEWGAAYDQRIKEATRAAREFGFTKPEIDALESQIGFDGVMKRFQALGAKIGESSFHVGDGDTGALTPDQAQDKIRALKGDPAWVKKYTSGDVTARAELEKLHKMAHPGETSV